MACIDQCIITLTRNCNLRCDFCYAKRTGYIAGETLEYENVKKIIDFCSDAKVKFVVFTGGEPAMYPFLLDAIRYVRTREHQMMATIATNGILLSDFDYCRKLIESGLDYIDVSLKGKSEKECLEVVGKECLSNQLKAINNLSKLSVDFTCSMVLTNTNVVGFCEAIEMAKQNGAKQFSFTFALDNEVSNKRDIEYLRDSNPYYLIDSFIEQIPQLDRITNGEWWVEYTFPLCIYTERQMEILKGKLAAPCQIYKGNGITFDTNMNLLPCSMFIDDKIGQFGSEFGTYQEFEKYINGNPYRGTIDKLAQMPSEICRECNYLDRCYGGCPVFWKNCSFDALMQYKGIMNGNK